MLHEETVQPHTLDLIQRLMKDEKLKEFTLVGGTALSLQIVHRKSIDIDLFSPKGFDSVGIAKYLEKEYNAKDIAALKNGVFCYINGDKLDLIAHQYPIVKPPVIENGIRMASLEDIGAMKLNAMSQSGSRLKDFVDMYFLLEKKSLREMTSAYLAKYPEVNEFMARAALLYHEDILHRKIDFMGEKITFEKIKERFKDAVIEPPRIFLSIAEKQRVTKHLNEDLPAPPEQKPHKGKRK